MRIVYLFIFFFFYFSRLRHVSWAQQLLFIISNFISMLFYFIGRQNTLMTLVFIRTPSLFPQMFATNITILIL